MFAEIHKGDEVMKIEDLKFNMPDAIVDEKNWDKEKWKKENPMDYLKAVHLILSSRDWVQGVPTAIAMQTAFEAIYRVTRLYIPEVLYKFNSLTNDKCLNNRKLRTLQNGKIYMSDIKDFNDPFDGKAFYYNPEQLKDIKRISLHNGRFIDDFTVFHKGAALTENDMNSMPMWAHYANNHRGYCVAYDMKETKNLVLSACTFPVQYTEQRLDITSFMKNYANMVSTEIDKQTALGIQRVSIQDLSLIYLAQYLCNIKQLSWKYEREFRCTIGAKAKGAPYIEAVPKAIYIGMKCDSKNKERLIKIARQHTIPIYQMNFIETAEDYILQAELVEENNR